jgi:tetratricopeptide (TPR) repeat protein
MAACRLAVDERDPAAHRHLSKALETAERIGALPEQIRSRTLLAEVEAGEGAFEQAAEHLRKVEKLMLECSSRPVFLPFSAALGAFYKRRGELEMALSAYDTARKLASYLAMPDWTWRFLAASGHLLVDMRRFDQASSYYRGAVEILSLLSEKLTPEDREAYLLEGAKTAVEDGLLACRAALVS